MNLTQAEVDTLRQAAQLAVTKKVLLKLPPTMVLELLDGASITEDVVQALEVDDPARWAGEITKLRERAEEAEEKVTALEEVVADIRRALP